jgi:protein pelota
MKAIVVGSPGFVKDGFLNFLKKEANERQNAFVKEIIGRVVLGHTSSGFKHSLSELL